MILAGEGPQLAAPSDLGAAIQGLWKQHEKNEFWAFVDPTYQNQLYFTS